MRFAALVLSLLISSLAIIASQPGSRAEYLGGTRPDIPVKNSGLIEMTDKTYFIFISKHTRVKIPYSRINLVEYGQDVSRRVLAAAIISPAFTLLKKREHFLTIGFQNDDGGQEAMMFRVDKNDVRLTLVSLEARTGQKVEFQDEDARIAGK
jgi:hypothetical protein